MTKTSICIALTVLYSNLKTVTYYMQTDPKYKGLK